MSRSFNLCFINIHLWITVIIIINCASCDTHTESQDYNNCTIYRDAWGVPHIQGKTDSDVAYGLAWASCEDDFNTIQEQFLAIRGRLGEVKGSEGIRADFAIKYMGIRDYTRQHIDELEVETLSLIDGYIGGINAYAKLHPSEVLLDDLFPIEPVDLVSGYALGLTEISGAASDLAKLADGSIIEELHSNAERGSNAIAISNKKTEEGQTFLAINSHQPMEGWYSWYEAHLVSDEGLNILGGTFMGSATIFHGTNEHLGWAHTVNHADFSDVYKLTMHPEKEHYYKMDDQWLPLEKKTLRSWFKILGPIKIPITRSIYESRFGITFKVGDGYFAWRFQARESVKAIEQWYKMSKADSFEEWYGALGILGVPCTNIVYADKDDNIFYISNARQPIKDSSIDWSGIIEGVSSGVLWSDRYWSIDSLPQVLNPPSGYIFNTNNTPYSATADIDNSIIKSAHNTMGFEPAYVENNRSLRFQELMDTVVELSYKEFLEIKYNRTYPTPLKSYPYDEELLLLQDANKHSSISDAIALLNNWNRDTSPDNKIAPLFLLAKHALYLSYTKINIVLPSDYTDAIAMAKEELMSSYYKLDVPLGEFQRHRRGKVDLPIGGGADVLAAIHSKKDTDGKYRAYSGESYIQMVRFDSLTGPIIESVNAFGSSARIGQSHATDQMSLFVDQQLKPMTLDIDKIRARRTYHPKKILD